MSWGTYVHGFSFLGRPAATRGHLVGYWRPRVSTTTGPTLRSPPYTSFSGRSAIKPRSLEAPIRSTEVRMHSRQSKSCPLIVAVSFTVFSSALPGNVIAQPTAGPATIQPGPLNRPDVPIRSGPIVPPRLSGEDAESFKRSMAVYEQCTRDKAAEIRLAEAAQGVIDIRDKRTFWEPELKRNYTLRARYPQGYEQMLTETFGEYRSLGGSATTVAAVRPSAAPCTNPWETYRGPRGQLTDSKQIQFAPK